jgi:1-deoxy-D-xylulose-5-phosphate reductoisomerase
MVAFRDGSVLAELGTPDMRIPIAYTLGWPRRIAAHGRRLDLAALGGLTFEPPDPARFPALRLAREALRTGGPAPTILNAANEIAVEAFVAGRVGFLSIAGIVEETLAASDLPPIRSLDDVLACDAQARRAARDLVQRHAGRRPARE